MMFFFSFKTYSHRFLNGGPNERPRVLFPNVSREDADKSVNLLVKYLFNYGFYKFGVEMTLIMMMILISFRQDILSIVYVVWLCVIIGSRRHTKHLIWPIFQYFIAIATVAQYAVMLNLPAYLYSGKQTYINKSFSSIIN